MADNPYDRKVIDLKVDLKGVQRILKEINEQKAMVNRSKIVLYQDFLECIYGHGNTLCYKSNKFGGLYLDFSLKASKKYGASRVGQCDLFFRVPRDEVERGARDWFMAMERKMAGPVSEKAAQMLKEAASDLLDACGVEGDAASNFLKNSGLCRGPDEEPPYYPGNYLGVYLDQLDQLTGDGSFLDRMEIRLTRQGYGQDMVDFWQRVRDIRDYSLLFPNRPPPPGKGEPQEGDGLIDPDKIQGRPGMLCYYTPK